MHAAASIQTAHRFEGHKVRHHKIDPEQPSSPPRQIAPDQHAHKEIEAEACMHLHMSESRKMT